MSLSWGTTLTLQSHKLYQAYCLLGGAFLVQGGQLYRLGPTEILKEKYIIYNSRDMETTQLSTTDD